MQITDYTFDDPNRPGTGQTHQRERPVLHNQTPGGVVQELYGLLLGHFVIRKLMCDAAEKADVAPRQLSFVNTLKFLRCRLPEAPRGAAGLRRRHQPGLFMASRWRKQTAAH